MKRYNINDIDKLVNILKNDGVISVPTDTVYGICAIISSEKAHNKLIKIKNRPKNKLFPIMCADENQIRSIAQISEEAEKLINTFMPGPITLILNKKSDLPEYINNGENTIAIRMATSDFLKKLILKLGMPIFMTSANQSGETPCSNLDEIEEKCPNLDAMLEGKVSFGIGSTIVNCASKDINIIRQGPITMDQINQVLKK